MGSNLSPDTNCVRPAASRVRAAAVGLRSCPAGNQRVTSGPTKRSPASARDRTMASAYSVRPTPIATVSTPLTWDELAGAEPDDYTMATVPDLVQRRDDPWAGMDEVAQSIAPLLEMVEADEERGLGDLPYPPNYPKMPGEPKRVQPSKDTDLKRKGKSE